jgi:transcriptional regulator with XRE-family HTH domain
MVTPYIRQLLYPDIVRLGRVTPDEPAEPAERPRVIPGQRPCRSRPHSAATVAQVRQLFERTDLTYAEIAAQTGVTPGSITHWKRAGGWVRPAHAPRATEMVPDWRAGRRLKLRKLAARLEVLAERHGRELEAAPGIDVETLMQALQVVKMVRLEAMGHRGRGGFRVGPAVTGAWMAARDNAIRAALTEMRPNLPAGSTTAPQPPAFSAGRRGKPLHKLVPLASASVFRLRVMPDEPAEGPPAITEQRPRGSRRPHTDMVISKVRHLIEHTELSYQQIAAKTGVHRSSISLWARDGGWQRPPTAPRALGMASSWRASPRLKLRKLAIRLEALANRHVRELEAAPRVDVDALMQALQVVKMARLQALGRRGGGRRWPNPPGSGGWKVARDNAIRTALKQMRRGGVDIDRAPKEAVEMLIEANTPVEDGAELHPRGWRRRRRVG